MVGIIFIEIHDWFGWFCVIVRIFTFCRVLKFLSKIRDSCFPVPRMTADAAPRTRIVGELACQRDSYLRTLDSVVISCVEVSQQKPNDTAPVMKDKKTKNRTSNDEITEGQRMWEIEFSDSVLFPEGTLSP